MARALALAAIRFYQTSISPRKGFCCAYAAHLGRGSCSTLGYRAISRYGVWRGLAVLDARLEKCGQANRRYRAGGPLARQRGYVDGDGCDASDCELTDGCHIGDGHQSSSSGCLDWGDCDFGSSRRKKKEREKYVVVSPNTRLKR